MTKYFKKAEMTEKNRKTFKKQNFSAKSRRGSSFGWGSLSSPWKCPKVCETRFSFGAKSGVGWAEPTWEEIPDAAASLEQ